MDGIDILIYAFIVIIVITIIFSITLALLPDGQDYSPNSGSNSLGNWVMVNTAAGVMRSYIFRSPLLSSNGKYLDVDLNSKTIKFGQPIRWIFDGLKLYTESTGGFYYLNATENNTVYVSKEVESNWLYDGYNFYLNATLGLTKVSYLDSTTLKLKTVNKASWNLYEEKVPNWRPTEPFQ